MGASRRAPRCCSSAAPGSFRTTRRSPSSSPPTRPREVRSTAAFPGSVSAAAHVQTPSDNYFASRNKYFLLLTVFTVVVVIVAALTIYSAMSVITGSRVRETKQVRAIGGSSIGILAAAVVEATVLGLLGVALGLPLGVALAGAAPAVTEELGIRVPLDNVGLSASWLAAIRGRRARGHSALGAARGGAVGAPQCRGECRGLGKPRAAGSVRGGGVRVRRRRVRVARRGSDLGGRLGWPGDALRRRTLRHHPAAAPGARAPAAAGPGAGARVAAVE